MWFIAFSRRKVETSVAQTTAHAKKNGLSCVSARKGFREVGCYNSSESPDENNVDDNLGLVERNIFEII